jgi:diguanylate cyclase (GGDEF)-like protein
MKPNCLSEPLASGAPPLEIVLGSIHTYQTAFEHMHQGILLVDREGMISLANRRAINLLGLPQEMMQDRPDYREILDIQWKSGEYGPNGRDISPELRRMIKTAMSGRDLFGNLAVYERVRPNGTCIEVRTTPLPDGGLVRTYSDISERKRSEALIEHLARHDSLTGLANRRHFLDQLARNLGSRKSGCCLLLLDLDRFKTINDTRGHQAGDSVLDAVARRLGSIADKKDTIARIGGDEFAIIRPGRDRTSCVALAEEILECMSAAVSIGRDQFEIGASVGIAFAPFDASTTEDLFKCADLALYRAKRNGRNRYCCFDHDIDKN